ncbi:MAG: hypothetical protein Q9225_001506 [Loekoesia sp. 1 TL-2023]
MSPALWLRTCYSEGSNQKHEKLVGSAEMFNAVNGVYRLLNDPSLYNFGPHWQRVFDIFPELLEPSQGDWVSYQERQREAREALERFAHGGLANTPSSLLENLSYISGGELQEYVTEVLQSDVHKAFVVAAVVLEDDEALETGDVAVMFLDALGRVIRTKRIGVGEAQQMGHSWLDGSWDETAEWEEGDCGDDYEAGGSCEGLLLKSVRNA